jgi:hypothetical protein
MHSMLTSIIRVAVLPVPLCKAGMFFAEVLNKNMSFYLFCSPGAYEFRVGLGQWRLHRERKHRRHLRLSRYTGGSGKG